MYEDSPDDVVHELLSRGFFGSHPLGQAIIGTSDNVMAFTREGMMEYFDGFYTPDNLEISIAGNFDEDELISLLDKYFGGWKKDRPEFTEPQAAQPHSGSSINIRILNKPSMYWFSRSTLP